MPRLQARVVFRRYKNSSPETHVADLLESYMGIHANYGFILWQNLKAFLIFGNGLFAIRVTVILISGHAKTLLFLYSSNGRNF